MDSIGTIFGKNEPWERERAENCGDWATIVDAGKDAMPILYR